jgi:hypothetical protein
LPNQAVAGESWRALSQIDRGRNVLAILDRLIFYGLIAVMVLTAIPYGSSESWSKALFESAVFFLALLWIVYGLIDGSWRVGNARLIAPMFGLLVFAMLQSLAWWHVDTAGEKGWLALSSDPFETRIFAFRIATLILVLVLVTRFTTNSKRLGILVHAIVAVASASAMFGIARQLTQHGPVDPSGPGFGMARLIYGSGYAQFTNRNHFAFLMEMALGLVIGVGFMQRRRRDRFLLYLSVAMFLCAAVVLSRSRGGLLAIAVQIVFAGLLLVNFKAPASERRSAGKGWVGWARSIVATTVIAAALLMIIIVGVASLGGDQLSTGVETAALEMSAADPTEVNFGSRRRDIWRATWLMFKAHPVAGAGLGAFWAEVPVFHQASGVSTPQQAHNDYLELLASGGILGAGLFIWFAVALVKQARRSVSVGEGFQRAASMGAIIGVAGVGVHSIVDFGLHITINAVVFVVLLSILSLKSFGPETVLRKSTA